MKKIIQFLLLLLLSEPSFAEEGKSEIKKFLYTDPSQINFNNASKLLPKPFEEVHDFTWAGVSGDDKYEALLSKEIEFEPAKVRYSILKSNKNGHYLYGMAFLEPQNCESFFEIIKHSYGKEFTHNITDNVTVFGKKGKEIEGTINIKNWRAGLYCYEEEGDFFLGLITLGQKKYIKQIQPRQEIDCTMENGNQVVYQIDNTSKSLLGINNVSWGNSKIFNDDFIVIDGNKINIKIDRKSGRITITSQEDKSIQIFGSCEKRKTEQKF